MQKIGQIIHADFCVVLIVFYISCDFCALGGATHPTRQRPYSRTLATAFAMAARECFFLLRLFL